MKELKHLSQHVLLYTCCLVLLIVFGSSEILAEENNTDRPGMDYKNFQPLKADPCECAKACEDDQKCKAYTYVKPGQGASQAQCWLKDGIPLPKIHPNCISGVVRQEMCVHGNSGQIQNQKIKAQPLGWGLEYDVVGTGSWIQYSIPTNEAGTIIEAIRIQYRISQPLYG